MKNILCGTVALILLGHWLPLAAAVDVREFSSEEKRERYLDLVEELRCPKCQNQNLAGSDSPIALDLRRELYRLLEEDKTDREIKEFMVSRYGDYVLYRPPLQKNTLLLWWGPPIIFCVALIIVLALVWRRRKLLAADAAAPLSAEDQSQLERLLAQERATPATDPDQTHDNGNS